MLRSIKPRYKAINLQKSKSKIMKRTTLILLVLLGLSYSAHSQVELALKGGIHSIDLSNDLVTDGNSSMNFKDSKFGYHFGLHPRVSVLGIFIEPGLTFNSSSVAYTLNDASPESIVNETYKDIGIPVMAGFGSGFISVFGGPVLHYQIDKFRDIWGKSNLEQATMGYQAGVGLKLWRLRGEVRYEGNLTSFGNSVDIADHNVVFGQRASRLMFTVGLIL